ncbi:hypothetical protein [Kitasatospora kazusensis]
MEQSFDARGIAVTTGIDARGIKDPEESDARRNEPGPDVPACPECHAALRASGTGRRPVYCGRACSSKAYRRRRTEGHRDAVADALIASRVESPATPDGGAREELLQSARALERLAARYLDQLDDARQAAGDGQDPLAQRALERLEAGVEGLGRRVLRQARGLRYEMLVARREAAVGAVELPSGADLDSSRVESFPALVPGGYAAAPAPEAYDPAYDPAVLRRVSPAVLRSPVGAGDSTRGEMGIGPDSTREETRGGLDSTRDESAGTGRAADPAPAARPAQPTRPPVQGQREAAGTAPGPVPAEPRLALSQPLPSVLPPTGRGLGEPVRSYTLGGGLVHLTWPRHPGVQAVEYDRRLVGWVEEGLVDVPQDQAWAAVLDGRLVLDADDGQPMLSLDPGPALTLLGIARQQRLA